MHLGSKYGKSVAQSHRKHMNHFNEFIINLPIDDIERTFGMGAQRMTDKVKGCDHIEQSNCRHMLSKLDDGTSEEHSDHTRFLTHATKTIKKPRVIYYLQRY